MDERTSKRIHHAETDRSQAKTNHPINASPGNLKIRSNLRQDNQTLKVSRPAKANNRDETNNQDETNNRDKTSDAAVAVTTVVSAAINMTVVERWSSLPTTVWVGHH